MNFDLEHLTSLALFARVVQLRSFTAAANDARLAKSAVSRRISELERHLGVQLLRRSTRKLALTDEGMKLYEHSAKLLEAANAAHQAVEASSRSPEGLVRVSAPVVFSQMHLASAVSAFLKQHPGVQVSLTAEDRLVDVVDGGYDVVIRMSRLKDASFVARKLTTDRLVVCASAEYLDRHGRPVVPEELVPHNCLHYELVPLAGEWRFRGKQGPLVVPVKGNFSTSDGAALRAAVLAGLGIGVLPSFMVASELASGRVEALLQAHRRAEIGIYAVTDRSRQLPLRTRALIEFLARQFRDGLAR